MLVSEIMGARASERHTRRVGVRFPAGEHHRVMSAAVDVYRQLGLDVEVEDDAIFVQCGEGIAMSLMGVLERRTGRPGFNEWWSTPAPS